ncbi:LuxR C-terminal-related transcriptional regulator [uncultured Desulfosarcina sp.]|uniref:helix-turn-helix transcriptional regulator n=1 Tax=uncultured Desulfosarcina sp. TaxID=218289 RepID=UPI0029C7F78B|nr:LuxR C-terminal-related transcriptional regulator [uncultured Desulfosarcina sp.]
MLKALGDQLTKREALEILELSYQSLRCSKENDFKTLVLGLQEVLPFENAMCTRGNVVDILRERDLDLAIEYCDISYPSGYLEEYFENDDFTSDAVLMEFMTYLMPVSWSEVDKRCNYNYPASIKALDYNMRDGWAHGTINPVNFDCTLFFFGSSARDNSARSAKILEYVVPFYAQAYNNVLKKIAAPATDLTSREKEVLNWIKEGKSSWEISQILRCSERTVNFHVSNIKAKLGVVNRAQAVAVGLRYGVIRL